VSAPVAAYADEGSAGQGSDLGLEDILNLKVVTAAKTVEELPVETFGIITAVTRNEIDRMGARNLAQVLERFTDVSFAGSEAFRDSVVVIRGDLSTHYNNHVLMLINGRPIRESLFGGADAAILRSFPLNMVERVEVVRGPGSVLYGTNAFSGVVNIITQKPKKDYQVQADGAYGGYTTASRGKFDTRKADLSAGTKNSVVNANAGVRYLRESGWNFEATDEKGVHNSTLFGSTELGGFASFEREGLTASAFYGQLKEGMLGVTDKWPAEEYVNQRSHFDLGYSFHPVESLLSSFNVTFNNEYNPFDEELTILNTKEKQRSNDLLLETTHTWHIIDPLSLIVGGVATWNNYSSRTVNGHHEIPYSFYAQAEYKPIQQLKFVLGAQANKAPDVILDFVPRVGALYNLNKYFGLKAMYGEAFRAPTGGEKFISQGAILQGNKDLRSEKIRTADIQLNHQNDNYQTSLTYFHSRAVYLIGRGRDPITGINTYLNSGNRVTDGAELEGKWVPIRPVLVNLGTSYQYNVQDGVKDGSGFPRWMLKLGGAYTWQTLTIGANEDFYAASPHMFYAPGKAEINGTVAAYHWVTANINWDFKSQFNIPMLASGVLSVYAENLADASPNMVDFNRKQVGAYPARPGRSVMAQVTLGI